MARAPRSSSNAPRKLRALPSQHGAPAKAKTTGSRLACQARQVGSSLHSFLCCFVLCATLKRSRDGSFCCPTLGTYLRRPLCSNISLHLGRPQDEHPYLVAQSYGRFRCGNHNYKARAWASDWGPTLNKSPGHLFSRGETFHHVGRTSRGATAAPADEFWR